MANQISCPNCGALNDADATVCASCSQPLKQVFSGPGGGNKPAGMTSLMEFALKTGFKGTAEDLLGAYAEDAMQARSGGTALVHRDAARKQLLAMAIFALVTFLDVSGLILYHRNEYIFIMIFIAALIALLVTRKKFSNRKTLVQKLAAMPDAEVDSVLEREYDAMTPKLPVMLLKLVMLAVVVAALGLLFSKPHMIFEGNSNGCSLRYYTWAISMPADVEIPEVYNGMPVTTIRGNVFQNLSGIRSVRLPSGITEVRGSTFEGCSGLVSIDIPAGVTRIGGHAFCDCRSLSRVSIPASLQQIGSSAFRRCYNLKSISLPQNCSVNSKAFKESPTKITRF